MWRLFPHTRKTLFYRQILESRKWRGREDRNTIMVEWPSCYGVKSTDTWAVQKSRIETLRWPSVSKPERMIDIKGNHADDDATPASSCLHRVDDHRPRVSGVPLSSLVTTSPIVLESRFQRIPRSFRITTYESMIITRWPPPGFTWYEILRVSWVTGEILMRYSREYNKVIWKLKWMNITND